MPSPWWPSASRRPPIHCRGSGTRTGSQNRVIDKLKGSSGVTLSPWSECCGWVIRPTAESLISWGGDGTATLSTRGSW